MRVLKILIVEDVKWLADKMAEALKGLGEISICTVEKVKLESGFADERMPPLERAVELVKSADVVLLDEGLGPRYSGRDLLPYCNGKKVISISLSSIPGMVNWIEKLELKDEKPEVAERLKNLVATTIQS